MLETKQESTRTAVSFCLMIVIVFLTIALKFEARRKLEAMPSMGTLETFADIP